MARRYNGILARRDNISMGPRGVRAFYFIYDFDISGFEIERGRQPA